MRVLELGTTIAGPFCGRLLADFGAEVVKVEPPEGDPIRGAGKLHQGVSLYAASILRGKRLIAADLRKPEAQALIRRLAPRFDVVIENFRPGALEKWGLGYADVAQINPGLVMCASRATARAGLTVPARATVSCAKRWAVCATSSAIPTGRRLAPTSGSRTTSPAFMPPLAR